MKTIISKIYFDNILKFPGRTLIALIIILSSSSIFISNFKLDASADSLILENDKDLMTYRETTKNYSTNDFVIFTFTPNKSDIFNSRNLDAMIKLQSGDRGDLTKLGFQDMFGVMIAGVGSSVNSSKIAVEVQEENAIAAKEAEAEFAGVNLDTEAAALIEFQQAYQASARILSTARELFQSLMEVV